LRVTGCAASISLIISKTLFYAKKKTDKKTPMVPAIAETPKALLVLAPLLPVPAAPSAPAVAVPLPTLREAVPDPVACDPEAVKLLLTPEAITEFSCEYKS